MSVCMICKVDHTDRDTSDYDAMRLLPCESLPRYAEDDYENDDPIFSSRSVQEEPMQPPTSDELAAMTEDRLCRILDDNTKPSQLRTVVGGELNIRHGFPRDFDFDGFAAVMRAEQ